MRSNNFSILSFLLLICQIELVISTTASNFACSIGLHVENWVGKSNRGRHSPDLLSIQAPLTVCRGGSSAAVKTMSARQMETFKYVCDE